MVDGDHDLWPLTAADGQRAANELSARHLDQTVGEALVVAARIAHLDRVGVLHGSGFG